MKTDLLRHVMVLDGPGRKAFLQGNALVDSHGRQAFMEGTTRHYNPGRNSFLEGDVQVDDPERGADTDSCRKPVMAEHNVRPKPPSRRRNIEAFDDGWAPQRPDYAYKNPDPLPKQTRASVYADELRSRDGIAACCFHGKAFTTDPNSDPDGRNPAFLKYWIDRAESEAKLDAIVIPGASGSLAYEHVKPLLDWLQEWRPEINVLLVCHNRAEAEAGGWVREATEADHAKGHYGQLFQEGIDRVAYTKQKPLAVHHGVDVSPQNILREMLGRRALPKRTGMSEQYKDEKNIQAINDQQAALYQGPRYENWRNELREKKANRPRKAAPAPRGVAGEADSL